MERRPRLSRGRWQNDWSEGFLCVSSLKERGRSIPTRKILWVLYAVPSVQAGSRRPADGVRVERPQRSEDLDLGTVKG
jgi:hypothetical protein